MDVSLEKDSVGPFLGSSKYHPDSSPEEGSSRQLSHEQMKEYTGDCRVFYDPIVEYMEGLGNSNDWSHLYGKYQSIFYNFLPLSISFLSIKHEKRTTLLGKLLDWLHWKYDFT